MSLRFGKECRPGMVQMSDGFVSIGEIVNTQGNRGEVRAIPLTDYPERFERMETVSVFRNGKRRELHIEQSYLHKRFIVLKFREIQDMNAAEELKGSLLQVRRDDLVELPDEHYYLFQIVGLEVYDLQGERLGKVTDVLQTSATDIYVINRGGLKPLLVPARKEFVREISLENGRITVELPEGLLEL